MIRYPRDLIPDNSLDRVIMLTFKNLLQIIMKEDKLLENQALKELFLEANKTIGFFKVLLNSVDIQEMKKANRILLRI